MLQLLALGFGIGYSPITVPATNNLIWVRQREIDGEPGYRYSTDTTYSVGDLGPRVIGTSGKLKIQWTFGTPSVARFQYMEENLPGVWQWDGVPNAYNPMNADNTLGGAKDSLTFRF